MTTPRGRPKGAKNKPKPPGFARPPRSNGATTARTYYKTWWMKQSMSVDGTIHSIASLRSGGSTWRKIATGFGLAPSAAPRITAWLRDQFALSLRVKGPTERAVWRDLYGLDNSTPKGRMPKASLDLWLDDVAHGDYPLW